MMDKCSKCHKGEMIQIYPRDYVCDRCGYEEYFDFNKQKIKKVL
jgi:ribosomal protein S27AE